MFVDFNILSRLEEYTKLGYRLLPLEPSEKPPCAQLVPHGLKEASRDPITIQRWCRDLPRCGWGLLPPAPVLVLDFDAPEAWKRLSREHPELLRAPRQRTPRGGYHVFLRLPESVNGSLSASTRKLPGVDLRGMDRAYVVVEPTTINGARYTWEVRLVPPDKLPLVSNELLEKLLPPPPPALTPTPPTTRTTTGERTEKQVQMQAELPRNEKDPLRQQGEKGILMSRLKIPQVLGTKQRWLLWKTEGRNGKATKVPYQPNGKKARVNDPSTWASLEEALEALKRGGFEGLGFVLGDGIAGVDIDWKGWKSEGIPPEVQAVVEALNSYTETSPSGQGCHVLLLGRLPEGAGNKHTLTPGVELEVYDQSRFFTFTGQYWEGLPTELQPRQAELEALIKRLNPQQSVVNPASKGARAAPDLEDEELLERMFAAKPELHQLWEGDVSGYRSHSEADLALASALMWWTGNDLERADRLFRQSALYRPKWDKKHYSDGRTYGQATLEKARAVDGGYQPRVVSVNRRGQVHTAAKSTAHTTRIAPLDGLAAGGEVLGQPRYRIAHGRIEAAKVEGKGEHQSVTYWPLANFAAVVAREVETTDGLESEQIFELVGYTATGRPLPAAKVKAAEFAGMTWPVRAWGAEVVVTPGQGAKDHLRAAIQYLSIERGFDRAKVYKHLGWTQVNGEYVYLHAGGGIGAQGSVAGLEVEPGKTLEAFAFPDPPTGQDERQAVEAMLEVLDAAPERITAPLLLHTLAAPLGHSPVSIYLAGPTGARKTSLALVLQSFFGYHAAPPAAWEATPNALENAAFLAKDALLLIDDYAPQASEQKQKELQAKAARLLRSQGNSTGRLRMKADGSLAGDRPPRGSLLITGEDIPPGHSIRARGLFVEVERGDVDLARLSRLQTLARNGALARGMAAWIRYLAGRLDAVRRQVEARTAELRGRWEAEHGRTTDALARLHAVWEFFRDYAAGLGLDVATLEQRLLAGLEAVRAAQSTYQRDADPVQRFMTLLFTALRMGRCHLLPVDWRPGQDPEEHMAVPQNYGWRWVDTTSGSSEAHGIWQPQGPRIGWLPENPDVAGIYLDPTAAYAVLSRLAGETGEPLPTERTLWKRLAQAGAIRTQVSGGETRYQVGVRIHERTTRAIHLLGAYISKTGNTGNNGNNSVPDSENRVAGFENVAGSDRQQNRAPNEPSGLLPETTGNTTATGNNGSPVPDAKNTGVAGVAGSTDIGGQAAHTETREPENREKRGRLEL